MQSKATRQIVSKNMKYVMFLLFNNSGFEITFDNVTGSEVNSLDFTPLYDTIILSDVADIINEFENNMVSVTFLL